MYFDKPAKDLSLEEAASIVAIIPTPSRLSPFRNPEQNLARRNTYVLRRMTEEGYITGREAADAAKRPLVLQGQPAATQSIAPYFVEEIRKVLEQKYGADALYQAGLRVQTTLDVEAAGSRQSRSRSRIAANRQTTKRLSQAGAQRRRRGQRHRDVSTRALVSGHPRRGHRSGRRHVRARTKERGNARVRIGSHEVDLPPPHFNGPGDRRFRACSRSAI